MMIFGTVVFRGTSGLPKCKLHFWGPGGFKGLGMLKDFRVTDSLGLKHFRLKGIWRLHDLGVKPSSACCELRTLQRDHVQWITAADTPSCGQKKHTRWPATNSKCWCAIMRSEKTHTLACNECFGMQWITGPQRIPGADVPSCGQKRHTHAGLQRMLRH